jgi:hypothetical protein
MAAMAHFTETSYVFRGKLVLQRVLCEPLGQPPPDALATFEQLAIPPGATPLEASAAVRAEPRCSACHSRLDPLGIAFEGFDAIGGLRAQYASGAAVLTGGSVEGVPAVAAAFADAAGVLAQVAASGEVERCLTRQLFRFTFAREEQEADACALQGAEDHLLASGGRLDELIIAATLSDAFRYRRVTSEVTP